MACRDGCCGSSNVQPNPLKVPNTTQPAESGRSRCCIDSDVEAASCCDDDCLRLIALQDCIRSCGPPNRSLKEPKDESCCESGGSSRQDEGSTACTESQASDPNAHCKVSGSQCPSKNRQGCATTSRNLEGVACSRAPDTTLETWNDLAVSSIGKNCDPPCCSSMVANNLAKDIGRCDMTNEARNPGATQTSKATCCNKTAGTCERRTPKEEPCPSHLEAARRRYNTMFGAMSCMCKALLAQGLESCCTTKRKLSAGRFRNAPSSRVRNERCTSKASGSATGVRACDVQSISSRKSSDGSCNRLERKTTLDESCRSDAKDIQCISTSGCCTSKDAIVAVSDPKTASRHTVKASPYSRDIESGEASVEHLVFSVQGMTCTGCETKLHRSIKAIPSATNAQASIVLSRAEFDIDPRTTTSEQAVVQLERATGFILTKLSSAGHQLHVKAPAASRLLEKTNLPKGVLDVRRIDDETIGISYDAHVVGARELLDHSFGSKLELAPMRPPENISVGAKHVRHVGFMTVFSAVLTIPVLIFAWAPLPPHETAYQSASLGLATVVQVVIAGPFYSSALRSLLFSRVIEMDLLIVLSTSAAYIFSIVAYSCYVAGRPLSTGEFFESSTLLVTLIMLGRFISAFARQKAVESISITSLQPANAVLVSSDGDIVEEIDSRLLQYGDVFKVLPDSRIVTDGTVVSGGSEVDESMVTGESKLVAKGQGSNVVAGSINGAGLLHVKVARLPGDNTISSVAEMVDQAKLSKPKIQDFADKVAGYFVPVIVAITIVVFCIWISIGMAVRHESGSEAVVKAITYAIAVLIVSCPCAVGLAVPMVIVISCGVGAEYGVVFKSAQSIESSWRATHVVFDKTGTLTQGNASVVEEAYIGTEGSDNHSLLLGLVSGNKHPNSTALAKHLQTQDVRADPFDSVQALVGRGVEGTSRTGKLIRAGSAKWQGLEHLKEVQDFQSRGLTSLCFTIDGKPQAVFGLADTIRPQAEAVVRTLMSRGISVSIVSGDDFGPVEAVGRQLGIEDLRSRCSPQDKQKFVQEMSQDKKNIVIFCGDGSNDAGALAQATIGVHMSEGTDVARSASDAVLMRPDISGLLKLMDISRAAYRRIVLNFVWAGVYNLFAVLLAAGAFVGFRLPPEYAGLGEVVSVLPVILIALHMKWAKFSP